MKNFGRDLSNQAIAGAIQHGIRQQEILKAQTLEEILRTAVEKTISAQMRYSQSLDCIEHVRDFSNNPEGILGCIGTKHGEIAEHVEVEIRNGRDILNSLRPSATFESVGRTAPEDYIIDGLNVQSKFTNHFNKSLKAVIGHLESYPNFTDNGFYHIPKDQFEIISKIANGETLEGISTRSVLKCKELIGIIEKETGKPFSEVVFSGTSEYVEVQLGTIDHTLDGYEAEFSDIHNTQVKEIHKEHESAKETANHITDFSAKEALKYGAISAIITGGVSASLNIYSKIKSGTKITDFSIDDWKDIGIDFTKSDLKGGITGVGIYSLTKGCGFSAPFAGAVASAAVGVASLYSDYHKGNISEQEFCNLTNSLCVESAFTAIGATLGQTVIPIPVLGAVIGSAVSKSAIEITRFICNKDEAQLMSRMEMEYCSALERIEAEAKEIILRMEAYYTRLGGYIEAAMSVESAARLSGSIELSRFLGIPTTEILHSITELDDFMNK